VKLDGGPEKQDGELEKQDFGQERPDGVLEKQDGLVILGGVLAKQDGLVMQDGAPEKLEPQQQGGAPEGQEKRESQQQHERGRDLVSLQMKSKNDDDVLELAPDAYD